MLVGRKVSQESGSDSELSLCHPERSRDERSESRRSRRTPRISLSSASHLRPRREFSSRIRFSIAPFQKRSKRLAAMAVSCLLLCRQFRKCFLNRRKIKQRIISETILPARCVKNHAFCFAMKDRKRLAVPRRRNHTNESSGAFIRRHASNLANQSRIIFFIVGIEFRLVRFFRRIPCRMGSRSPAQRVDLKPRVIRQHNFSRRRQTIFLCLLARVRLEGQSIFDNGRKRREARDRGNLNPMRPSRPGKVTNLASIGSRNQYASHMFT